MSEIPSFMREASNEHLRESMREYRELWITAAKFVSMRGGNREDRLTLIMMADDLSQVGSLAQWKHEVAQSYQGADTSLEAGAELPADKKVRALYMRSALIRLLELVDAPQVMITDIFAMLKSSCPKGAPKRGDLQAALIDYPELADKPAELAAETGCSRRLVDRYLNEESVQRIP